jgi:hypothetical protein
MQSLRFATTGLNRLWWWLKGNGIGVPWRLVKGIDGEDVAGFLCPVKGALVLNEQGPPVDLPRGVVAVLWVKEADLGNGSQVRRTVDNLKGALRSLPTRRGYQCGSRLNEPTPRKPPGSEERERKERGKGGPDRASHWHLCDTTDPDAAR